MSKDEREPSQHCTPVKIKTNVEERKVDEAKKANCCWTDRRQTGRTEGQMDRDMKKTSQDSPPVTVVGGNVAATHSHTFVVVG